MIPKILHYVWVGDKEKPESVKAYIESWKKHCPDYMIMEWDNEKFGKTNNRFAKQAFENRKWAFVSDYLRLYALYNYGGIYLDTDVEITNNIDKFLTNDFFIGFEKYKNNISCATALIGATPTNFIIKALLDYYNDKDFETKKGLDMTPNTQIFTEHFCKEFNLSTLQNGEEIIKLDKNSIIYPYYYFCQKEEKHSENYAIHHFDGSWIDSYKRKHLINIFNKYSIILFKLRKNKNPNIIPLIGNEKFILKLQINSKNILGLIKRNKNEKI